MKRYLHMLATTMALDFTEARDFGNRNTRNLANLNAFELTKGRDLGNLDIDALDFHNEEQRDLGNLYDKWRIDIPNVTFGFNNTITMDYGVTYEELDLDGVRTEIMTDSCEQPDLVDGILGTFVNAHGAQVFQIDSVALRENEEVFTLDDPNHEAWMKFCMRYSLWTGPESDANAVEINYLYTKLTLHVDLQRGFVTDDWAVDITTKNKDGGGDGSESYDEGFVIEDKKDEPYEVISYLCDPYTYSAIPPPPGGYGRGEFIAICAQIGESARAQGVYLKGVDTFIWTRTTMVNGVPTESIQYAIKDGIVANALTEYNCPMWALFCTFRTVLGADFYSLPGNVTGYGAVSVGFEALDDETESRRTLEREGDSVQDEPWEVQHNNNNLRATQQLRDEAFQRSLQLRSEANRENNGSMKLSIPLKVWIDRPKLIETSGAQRIRDSDTRMMFGLLSGVVTMGMWLV